MTPSSSSRLAVIETGIQRSGQLIASSLPGPRDGGSHGVGLGERAGERLLDQDVDAMRGDPLGPDAVRRGGGAEDREIGPGLLQALVGVGEDAVRSEAEVARRVAHALRLLVGDADDLRVGTLESVPEEVAHVEVVEIDPDNFQASHARKVVHERHERHEKGEG